MECHVERENLLRDQRGVIAVTGVLMGAFLIGAVWYVWGIGNAIQYRENMQNSADTSAFAAAVFDARGMNVLALINIIMTIVMMFLVAVKLVQAVVLVINILTCVAGGPINPLCDASATAEVEIGNVADRVGNIVLPVERVLHYAESGLAVIWPWLGEAKSMEASLAYKPGVIVGTTWATAMIPMSLNSPGDFAPNIVGAINFGSLFGNGGFVFQNPFAGKGGDGWFHGRYGLPVQNDVINNECSMAGEYVLDVLSLPFTNLPLIGGMLSEISGSLKSILGFVTGALPEFFCNNNSAAIRQAAQAFIGMARSFLGMGGGGGATPSLPGGSLGGFGKVMADQNSSLADTVPKILYGNFGSGVMGDDNFAVWSDVVGNWNDIASKGVNVATAIKKGGGGGGFLGGLLGTLNGLPPPDVLTAVAKSEFYYEPRPGDQMSQETADMPWNAFVASELNCMWNMRWRARLRRYRPAAPMFQFAVSNLLQGLFNSTIIGAMKGLAPNSAILGLWGSSSDKNPYLGTCNVSGTVGWAAAAAMNPMCLVYAGESKLGLPGDPGSAANPTPPAPGIYH
jgi:hypothetical protein